MGNDESSPPPGGRAGSSRLYAATSPPTTPQPPLLLLPLPLLLLPPPAPHVRGRRGRRDSSAFKRSENSAGRSLCLFLLLLLSPALPLLLSAEPHFTMTLLPPLPLKLPLLLLLLRSRLSPRLSKRGTHPGAQSSHVVVASII